MVVPRKTQTARGRGPAEGAEGRARPRHHRAVAARCHTDGKTRKGRGGLVTAVLVLLVLAGGGAAWFTGALAPVLAAITGPKLPLADPYTLIVEKPAKGAPRAIGFAPSEEARNGIAASVEKLGGAADVQLARGAIADSWGADVAAVMQASRRSTTGG